MRLFLQLDINDWQKRSYQQPMTRFASSLASDIISADMDSQSDPHVVELILRLVNEAKSIFVWINAEPDAPVGSGSKLLNQLLHTPNKVSLIIVSGQNPMVEKLVNPFQDRFQQLNDWSAVQEKIKEFAEKLD